jgi:hypothetical protein
MCNKKSGFHFWNRLMTPVSNSSIYLLISAERCSLFCQISQVYPIIMFMNSEGKLQKISVFKHHDPLKVLVVRCTQ